MPSWWRRPKEDRSTLRDVTELGCSAWTLSIIIPPIVLTLIMLGHTLWERLSGASGPQRPHDTGAYLPLAAGLTVALPIALVILICYAVRQRARRKRGLIFDRHDH